MGEKVIAPSADVYALGCVLYEMLTGEPPFTGPTAQAIVAKVLTSEPEPVTTLRKTVPPHVEAAVMTALEKLPADRFASAREFAEALAETGAHAGHGGTAARSSSAAGAAAVAAPLPVGRGRGGRGAGRRRLGLAAPAPRERREPPASRVMAACAGTAARPGHVARGDSGGHRPRRIQHRLHRLDRRRVPPDAQAPRTPPRLRCCRARRERCRRSFRPTDAGSASPRKTARSRRSPWRVAAPSPWRAAPTRPTARPPGWTTARSCSAARPA